MSDDPNRREAEGRSPGASYVMSMGVDPGFAKSGIGGVYYSEGRLHSAGVKLIKTEKNKEKRFENLRASMDDEARFHIMYEGICESIETLRPCVIGVEVYTIFESKEYERLRDAAAGFLGLFGLVKGQGAAFKTPVELLEALAGENMFAKFIEWLSKLSKAVDAFRVQRGRGNAAKTFGAYVLVLAAAYRYKIPIYGFMPIDLKKAACGRASATKDDVARALSARIEGLQVKVESKVRAKLMHEHVYDASGHAMLALETYQRWMRDSGMGQTSSWVDGAHGVSEIAADE